MSISISKTTVLDQRSTSLLILSSMRPPIVLSVQLSGHRFRSIRLSSGLRKHLVQQLCCADWFQRRISRDQRFQLLSRWRLVLFGQHTGRARSVSVGAGQWLLDGLLAEFRCPLLVRCLHGGPAWRVDVEELSCHDAKANEVLRSVLVWVEMTSVGGRPRRPARRPRLGMTLRHRPLRRGVRRVMAVRREDQRASGCGGPSSTRPPTYDVRASSSRPHPRSTLMRPLLALPRPCPAPRPSVRQSVG